MLYQKWRLLDECVWERLLPAESCDCLSAELKTFFDEYGALRRQMEKFMISLNDEIFRK